MPVHSKSVLSDLESKIRERQSTWRHLPLKQAERRLYISLSRCLHMHVIFTSAQKPYYDLCNLCRQLLISVCAHSNQNPVKCMLIRYDIVNLRTEAPGYHCYTLALY